MPKSVAVLVTANADECDTIILEKTERHAKDLCITREKYCLTFSQETSLVETAFSK